MGLCTVSNALAFTGSKGYFRERYWRKLWCHIYLIMKNSTQTLFSLAHIFTENNSYLFLRNHIQREIEQWIRRQFDNKMCDFN